MPISLDGQINLAALTVPGVFGEIVLPSPLLVGTPTNLEGLVGVASWGPVNSITPVTKVTDGAVVLGPPTNRKYDIMSYVEAATQVGGAISFLAVRVTDGTDTAASATVQTNCLTLTGLYSGSLGNQIQFSVQAGSQAGSYMGVVALPGLPAEQFNNVGLGIGSIAVTAGTGYTSVPSASVTAAPAGGVNAVVQPALTTGGAPTVSAGGAGYAVNDLLYLPNGVTLKVATVTSGAVATVTVVSAGSLTGGSVPSNPVAPASTSGSGTGATFTLSWVLGTPNIVNAGSGYTTAPTITLTGGGGTGGAYTASLSVWLNMANAINNGNASHGPSKFVIAAAGSGTTVPVLSSPVTLSGGTDGANGVTDSTLVGQDTLPRKGMYALRGSLASDFALVDHSTSSHYAAISAFALSELMLPVFSTVSGDSPANAILTVGNSANDTPWGWCIVGDYPTYYSSYNSVSRQIDPAAFAIGLLGNLSPQQSPLNKPLQGVTATQRSQIGMPYSDAELSLVNTGRIDVIVPPANSAGGNYFSFASGRNMSSNTAANDISYTRMTNFLMRAAKTKAAGSIIGKNQSVQANDQTRGQAKALFDGFSAQLADPASGLGINGQGLIDGWATQCDLNNNPPNLQALGYLFLFWQVKYLNTVRYFVVKFAGSGAVQVSVQSTAPTTQQFSS